jgi:hypothetical protein
MHVTPDPDFLSRQAGATHKFSPETLPLFMTLHDDVGRR